MKAYHEVCEDIIKMLEEIEESLEDINQENQLSETQVEISKTEFKPTWLERHFDFIKKPN